MKIELLSLQTTFHNGTCCKRAQAGFKPLKNRSHKRKQKESDSELFTEQE